MKRPFILLTAVILLLHSCSTRNREAGQGHQESQQSVNLSIPELRNVDPIVKTQLAGFLEAYFELNQALIEDSLAGARVAADDLAEVVGKFEMSNLSAEQMDFYLVQSSMLKTGLQEISGSDDIEKARTGLATVSEAMYALVKAFHPNESILYYQYCPMARNNKGASWISATEELVNPYMGQIMLQCGRTQEKLE